MFILKFLLSFFGGSQVKLVIAAVVLTAGLSVILGTTFYVKSLKKDVVSLTDKNNNLAAANKILEDNNSTLKQNQIKLQEVNASNASTINALKNERNQAVAAVQKLANTNAISKEAIEKLNKKIQDLLKDPKNDGPVAPVLREVIREIQKERAK